MFDNECLVSVIIPVYNNEKYIGKCIESVLLQTYKKIEIIVINDGSSDNSDKVIYEIARKNKNIKYFEQTNKGVSSARNLGIIKSSGEYICFVDGDDFVSEEYIEYLLNLCQYNSADVALTTNMFGNFNTKQIKNDEQEVWSNYQATINMLTYNIPIGVYNKLFSSSLIKSNNIIFFEELFIGEGFNFNMLALQYANKVAVGKKRLYYYRRDNPESATSKFSEKKWINGIRAIEIIKENLLFNDKNIIRAWHFANWRTHSDVYDIMILSKSKKDYPDLFFKSYSLTRREAFIGLSIESVSTKQKLRAVIMKVWPVIIPYLIKIRNFRYIKK